MTRSDSLIHKAASPGGITDAERDEWHKLALVEPSVRFKALNAQRVEIGGQIGWVAQGAAYQNVPMPEFGLAGTVCRLNLSDYSAANRYLDTAKTHG